MKSLLIGESATPARRQAVVRAIESEPAVREIVELRTQHLGPEELLACARVRLSEELDTRAVAAAIDAVQARVRSTIPGEVVLYLEPDLGAEGHDPGAG